jgi:indolepyruvate ferredoxin oxidoreductase
MMEATTVRPWLTLEDRYTQETGPILMSGVQALVRLTLDQRRLDTERGHDTAVFVSGYQGSPLGGVDREMSRAKTHLERARVLFRPGVNEELAATAVAGTQLLGQLPGRRHEGVVGFWFGKSPGLDRAADAIRHANLSGTAPLGGAVAWIGDDPASKSSTVPSACEPMCRSLLVPVLAPSGVGEVVGLGLHAVAISRHAGLWTALKIATEIADASATFDAAGGREAVPALPLRAASRPPVMLAPANLDAEHDLMTTRLSRVFEYAGIAGLNRPTIGARDPRLAVVAAGTTYAAVLRALDQLGLDDRVCKVAGLRLVKLSMPWPLDRKEMCRLLGTAETVLVVEDKLEFVETQVKEALYGLSRAPAVLGKHDAEGRPLLSPRGALGADEVAHALIEVLPAERLPAEVLDRMEQFRRRRRDQGADAPSPRRAPYFCSGCPHSTSVRAAPDQLVGVGIGCHTMVALAPGRRHGQLLGMPQMGGEGAQWTGLSPFTDDPHFIQNLGDGTFHHSGSLAIRGAVAAGVNITYKLLYNDAVAMTGGQRPQGRLDVASITRLLAVEGVARIVITTPEPELYQGVELAPIAQVRHRDQLQAAQAELAQVPGVTVLIHDDRCATEKRRLRKRGTLPAPAQKVWINERVCEGCGDCGEKSSCVSVLPVQTEFGRKTEIHQASCNQDVTCLKGDCPSFVVVTPKPGGLASRPLEFPPAEPPEPTLRVPTDVLIRMPGVGGTGVVTVSQILQTAAHVDGRHPAGLDQTGLAQKGGPVVSDLRISSAPVSGQLRATAGAADVVLGFDLLGAAAPETRAVCDAGRTVAILNTAQTATADMVIDPSVEFPAESELIASVETVTRSAENAYIDAGALAQRLFGDHMPANLLLVGAAFQHGCLPLSAAAIERAIELNGAAVQTNLAAFRWGRAAIADPAAVPAPAGPDGEAPAAMSRQASAILAEAAAAGELERLLQIRIPELIAYQGAKYARRYARQVMRVARVEGERTGGESSAVTEAYARGLFKLMAYKDEYEVARLHLASTERARLHAEFGPGARVQILLHPPILRSLGLTRKLRLGRSAWPLLGILRRLRHVRGTVLDPFGHTHMRRLERALITEYSALIDQALTHLNPSNREQIATVAGLPDLIRGYEQVKLTSVEVYRARASALMQALSVPEPVA